MKVSTSYPSVNSYQSTVEFHFTPVNKTNALMGWTGFGEIRKAYCWLKCKLRQSLLKLMCQCSSKTFVHLPNDGAVTLLGIYTKSSIYLSRGTYSWSILRHRSLVVDRSVATEFGFSSTFCLVVIFYNGLHFFQRSFYYEGWELHEPLDIKINIENIV